MVRGGKLPGAFIFEGSPEAAGGVAAWLAKAAVCADLAHKQARGEACGACASCRKADAGTHPDIITAEPEGTGARSFHIDKVREIIGGLHLSPSELAGGKKAYIIRDMQDMTQQGQNALLKSIEEPPPFVVFIITAANLDLLLETVKSRAVKFKLEPDGFENAPDDYDCGGIIRSILGKNGRGGDRLAAYQAMLKGLEKSGMARFYGELENAVRDIMVAKIFAGDLSRARFLYFGKAGADFELLRDCANNYSAKKIFEMCGKIQEFKSDLEYNANTRLNIAAFLSAVT